MDTLIFSVCDTMDARTSFVSSRPSSPSAEDEKPTLLEVFKAEESALLRFAHSIVGQRETAEDLVQDAFIKLHAHWLEVAQPRAWLFRCVRNLALSYLRDHRRETPIMEGQDFASPQPDPEQSLGKLEAIGSLQELVADLSPDDRTLVSLKYQEGLKYAQISQRTGLSVSHVGYKLHHALKNLAESLRRRGIESADG